MSADETASVTRRSVIQLTGAAFALPAAPFPSSYLENRRMSFTPKFVDLVRNYTTTTGTGNFVLGAAVNGYASFTSAVQTGDNFYYSAIGVDKPAEREVGRGTLQANGTISRDPISGTKTNFSSGNKAISLIAAAEWFTAMQGGGAGSASTMTCCATRTDLASASAAQPAFLTEAGREGAFAWNGSNLSAKVAADSRQGIYVAPASAPTGASGAWVRKFSGSINPEWFGISTANSGAQNDAARAAMDATLRARGQNAVGLYLGLEEVRFPAGLYNFATTWDLDGGTYIITGHGNGHQGGFATKLKWPASVTAIRVQGGDTSGATGTRASAIGAGGTIIRNLLIEGTYSGANGNFHGIHCRARASIEQVHINAFDGDGIYIDSNNGGNANNWNIDTVAVTQCRTAIFTDGPDANAGVCKLADCSNNRQWGIWDSSFLGNTYIACHADANVSGSYKTDSPNANNWFINCYDEGNVPSFAHPTVVAGGHYGAGLGGYLATIAPYGPGGMEMNGRLNAYAPIWTNQALVLDATAGGVQTIRASGAGSKLALEETGGSFGTSRLTMSAESGELGATFETTHPTATLTDFIFKTAAPGTHGLRYERRGGSLAGGNATYQFEFGAIGTPDVTFGDAGLNLASGKELRFNGTAVPLRNTTAARLIGRGSASAGVAEELTLANGLQISGTALGLGAITPASVVTPGAVTSSGGGIGYATGAGGTVTQATSKSTGVTLNKYSGEITMSAAALAANTAVTFTLTNNVIEAGDRLVLNHKSGGTFGAYLTDGRAAGGSATIMVRNVTATSLSEGIVLGFAVVKAVTS